MIRTSAAAAALAAALSGGAALPSAAFDISAMSPSEREAFGAAVRDYLLTNPTVLREAIDALQAAEAQTAAVSDEALVAAHAAALFEDAQSWTGGNPEGDVTVVEFLDYRCGYCRKAHPELAELIETDGEIRVIVKEFPILGPDSVEASRFAIAARLAAGDAAYARVSDALMRHQGAYSRDAFAGLAADLGLDGAAIVARMDDEEVGQIIARNHQLAEALEISGTPTFVFGETMVRGYAPLDAMREIVAAEREG